MLTPVRRALLSVSDKTGIVEFAREPDDFLGLLALGFSMGQWLSMPMIIAGIALFAWSYRRAGRAPEPMTH